MRVKVIVDVEARNNDTFAKLTDGLLAEAARAAVIQALAAGSDSRGYLNHDQGDAIAVKVLGTSMEKP